MAEPATTTRRCACIAFDRHDCWRLRYNLPHSKSVEDDGGPCECACHDDADDEEIANG